MFAMKSKWYGSQRRIQSYIINLSYQQNNGKVCFSEDKASK